MYSSAAKSIRRTSDFINIFIKFHGFQQVFFDFTLSGGTNMAQFCLTSGLLRETSEGQLKHPLMMPECPQKC
jgi:hypothetical protein